MNWIVVIIILGIVGFVALKNKGRILPLLRGKHSGQPEEYVQFDKSLIAATRREELEKLFTTRDRIIGQIESSTQRLREELQDVELRIAMLKESGERR